MARRGRCRCGTVLSFRKGPDGYKTRCPSCGSVVRLTTAAAGSRVRPATPASASPVRIQPAAAGEPIGARTVTCEACHRVVSAQASRCPGCGTLLALTTAAPALDAELASLRPAAAMALPYRRILGWLAAGVALMLLTIIVLIVFLRH
jgi:hypothetical protein